MPEIRDRDAIRKILAADPGWSVFAMGDLASPYWERCRWHRPASEAPAIVLVYRGFEIPVLFACGDPEQIATVLKEISEPVLYLHVREEVSRMLAARGLAVEPKPMWRMLLDPGQYRPERTTKVARLSPRDLDALRRLYARGEAAHEAPGFFLPTMLDDGAFFGVWEAGELTAAAGTQLIVPAEGVAAIGNVYTRSDRRGRGYAGAVTTAVVDDLLHRGLRSIALNVSQANAPAVRVYERLGFTRHCGYTEGIARR
jgi:ribosomal protein S18 acetylase RimI-like enzyme